MRSETAIKMCSVSNYGMKTFTTIDGVERFEATTKACKEHKPFDSKNVYSAML